MTGWKKFTTYVRRHGSRLGSPDWRREILEIANRCVMVFGSSGSITGPAIESTMRKLAALALCCWAAAINAGNRPTLIERLPAGKIISGDSGDDLRSKYFTR